MVQKIYCRKVETYFFTRSAFVLILSNCPLFSLQFSTHHEVKKNIWLLSQILLIYMKGKTRMPWQYKRIANSVFEGTVGGTLTVTASTDMVWGGWCSSVSFGDHLPVNDGGIRPDVDKTLELGVTTEATTHLRRFKPGLKRFARIKSDFQNAFSGSYSRVNVNKRESVINTIGSGSGSGPTPQIVLLSRPRKSLNRSLIACRQEAGEMHVCASLIWSADVDTNHAVHADRFDLFSDFFDRFRDSTWHGLIPGISRGGKCPGNVTGNSRSAVLQKIAEKPFLATVFYIIRDRWIGRPLP